MGSNSRTRVSLNLLDITVVVRAHLCPYFHFHEVFEYYFLSCGFYLGTFWGSLRCGGGGVFSWIGVIVFMFSN